MPVIDLLKTTPVTRSSRLTQLEGLFDVPPSARSEQRWQFNFPVDDQPWNIGLIVGPSGSGKSSVAQHLWPDQMFAGYDWPADHSLVDAFPQEMSIKDITTFLSCVGFSSPPAWLRPFRCLSNGEQFRAILARALAETKQLVVMDEFTSVVDRTVAQVGSAALAKAVRRAGRQFVAVTCHYDVEDWLQPDWVLEMPRGNFIRRLLQRRPEIALEIVRTHRSAWDLFKHHHYLNQDLSIAARCFVALWRGRPVAFASAIHTPGKLSCWREHRTVCLPDFQGVGIGNALSEFVASLYRGRYGRYFSTTGNPGMIAHRGRSPLWKMNRKPSRGKTDRLKSMSRSRAIDRITAGFEYVGPGRKEEADRYGI